MNNALVWLSGKKTYFLCFAAIVTAWASEMQGTISPQEAIQATFAALTGMTLRAGITKSGPTDGDKQ